MEKRLFRFTSKRNKAKKHLFRFALKRKRKLFGSETKRKYALLISLRSEAKNSKRKEAKKNIYFSRERVKRMRNGSRFASFRFEGKTFFCETGAPLIRHVKIKDVNMRMNVMYNKYECDV